MAKKQNIRDIIEDSIKGATKPKRPMYKKVQEKVGKRSESKRPQIPESKRRNPNESKNNVSARKEHSKRERMRFTDQHNYEIEKNMKGLPKPSKGKPRSVKQAVKIEKRVAKKSGRKLGNY